MEQYLSSVFSLRKIEKFHSENNLPQKAMKKKLETSWSTYVEMQNSLGCMTLT